ncbi:hypothetical protein RHMOL_Rhmol10G0270800 [Rhododendron molle]|uniref:Uncharacterized protein n=1 Tax=Rhododendron molle TaxID=49168 RepID=A0ACC0M7Y5_RHOML|nr:hypothetical protein RHMOL_Rhmol10G0270800 [Rhododendron molle]
MTPSPSGIPQGDRRETTNLAPINDQGKIHLSRSISLAQTTSAHRHLPPSHYNHLKVKNEIS